MGRIDAENMYDIVMNFDWGNSGSPDIYHDTETRRNGITYRSNLARLAEALMNEDEMEKAEDILDLAMEKMPVDDFGYYSLLEPYVLGYYELDKRDKARNLYQQVVKIYQEKLLYYSGMKVKRQFMIADEIISDMEKYRGLGDILIGMDEESFARPEANKFNDYLKLFRHFYSEEEGMDMDEDLPTDREIENALDLPIDTVVQDNTDVEPEL